MSGLPARHCATTYRHIGGLRDTVWNTPRAIAAHGTEDDPLFFYGNRLALQLFEMSFDEFARLPSRFLRQRLGRKPRR